MRNSPLPLAGLLAAAVALASAPAMAESIDFETINLVGQPFVSVGDPLICAADNTVTITAGSELRVYDLTLFGNSPEARGQALIDFAWPDGCNELGTTIDLAAAVGTFSLVAGDFGADDDGTLEIRALDQFGVELDCASATWPAGTFPPFEALTVSAPGIRTIVFQSRDPSPCLPCDPSNCVPDACGAGDFHGSVFLDKLYYFTDTGTVPVVPDGVIGAPMSVTKISPSACSPGSCPLRIGWDATFCSGAASHQVVFGFGSQLPSTAGNPYAVNGAVCGVSTPFDWLSAPDPAGDPSRLLWWLIVANDGSTEGSWGTDSACNERQGTGVGGGSDQCAGVSGKSVLNTCAQRCPVCL